MNDIPKEVLERQTSYWSPIELKIGLPVPENSKYFEPERLVFYLKSEVDRCSAWIKTLKTKKARFRDGKNGNGWRKCHTENYWCYYAKYSVDDIDEDLIQPY